MPLKLGEKNMTPGHKNVHLGFELEPTTSNETLQPAKFQLSNSQPQNHPTGPPVGRLIPSTEMHCNQFPSTQTCSLRKNFGLLGSIPPLLEGLVGLICQIRSETQPVGVVYICIYIYIYWSDWETFENHWGWCLSSQLLQEPINSHKVLKPCYF